MSENIQNPTVNETVTGSTEPLSFFQLLEKRLDPLAMEKELENYHGLLNFDVMEVLFEQKDAISIIKCLWTETNQELKVSWLRNHIHMRHPLLYFELAIEELSLTPTMETLLQVSMLYMHLATFRLEQDVQCYDSISPSIKLDIINIYNARLDTIARTQIQNPYLTYLQQQERLTKDPKNMFQSAKNSIGHCLDDFAKEVKKTEKLDATLPPPIWLSRLDTNTTYVLLSEEHWSAKRKQVVNEYLEMLEEI